MRKSIVMNNNFEEGFSNKDFLLAYHSKQKLLTNQHREYKQILLAKSKTRKQAILETGLKSSNSQLRSEKNDLKAKIWVANSVTYQHENHRYLKEIKCHVKCQEHLSEGIRKAKISISNLEREIGRLNKKIYELNRNTVPDTQFLAYVTKARKTMNILQNQLEVEMCQECKITATNAELREELTNLLHSRTMFNDTYAKLMQILNSDRKYIIELIEYAVGKFDDCIMIYERMNAINKRRRKENELRKLELQNIIRRTEAENGASQFVKCKCEPRSMADLPLKEYERRERFNKIHNKKFSLYSGVLEKIMEYTNSETVESVIEKFQEQENIYYSFFNYANEMGHHMTTLNCSVNRLFTRINILKDTNETTRQEQLDTIANLEDTLKVKQEENRQLQQKREENDTRLSNLLLGIEAIFEMTNADSSSLKRLLGDHIHVDLVNMDRFCKILESRILDIMASVYVMERNDEEKKNYVVRGMEKIYEAPTAVNDIVLTQQCPECAEGDAYNVDETAEGGVNVISDSEAKKNLYEKVNQPDMQYRLHSVSQCRLPRSRLVAAKRNV